VPRKHVSLLIDAFALLRRSHPDAELVLSGSHRDGLNGESRPGVRWTTLDDRQTLARVYAEAWVAALPASDEAFGLVLAEAMACGTPVVGYRHAAIPELIDDARVGRLFDALAPEPLGHALEEALSLARDPDTAAHCRARVSELSTDHMVERYLGLYRDLGAGGLERG
jgi:phosphatidylinositol alpha-mannosyltransferase